jgi:hypothetical protein
MDRFARARAENQAAGIQRRPFHFGAADLGYGQHGGQMLLHEARLFSPGARVFNHDRPARHQRQRQRRAEDLPAAVAPGAVDVERILAAILPLLRRQGGQDQGTTDRDRWQDLVVRNNFNWRVRFPWCILGRRCSEGRVTQDIGNAG